LEIIKECCCPKCGKPLCLKESVSHFIDNKGLFYGSSCVTYELICSFCSECFNYRNNINGIIVIFDNKNNVIWQSSQTENFTKKLR
jgi:hypothetical protein